MTTLQIINLAIMLAFFLCYSYQFFYIPVAWFKKDAPHREPSPHRIAVLIAARNEQSVIGNLIDSVKAQDYPTELVDVFVVADNCTDLTGSVAGAHGANVYFRNDQTQVGKGYALQYLLHCIEEDFAPYDGYLVLDADNVLSPDYITEINKTFSDGYQIVTSYRNSKNYDSNWISAGYAVWFLREAKFLNNARMMVGTSCAISGSGWMVSEKIVRGMHGWDFHTLTEDIQFSTFCCAHNIQIGFAPAEFFDEQPLTFKASWTQRMRWTKGFYQVFFSYNRDLLKGIRKGQFASYDMLMTIAPGMILTLLSFFVNAVYLIVGSLSHGFIATEGELSMCVGSLIMTFASMYVVFFLLAVITTISERKHIHAKKKWRIFTNLFTFPIFMMTYIPITAAALFKKVEWVPTKHDIAVNFDEVMSEGAK